MWQVGDLAVRLPSSKCTGHKRFITWNGPPDGTVMCVTRVRLRPAEARWEWECAGDCALYFNEAPTEKGWCPLRFRKVVHDEAEACESEFVTLLKRIKEPTYEPAE
jgi:hypothetical protein